MTISKIAFNRSFSKYIYFRRIITDFFFFFLTNRRTSILCAFVENHLSLRSSPTLEKLTARRRSKVIDPVVTLSSLIIVYFNIPTLKRLFNAVEIFFSARAQAQAQRQSIDIELLLRSSSYSIFSIFVITSFSRVVINL